MLKSTYRAAEPTAPLPPGWTEHKAPSGHLYYYNAETKQSTYTRPSAPSDEPLQIDYGAVEPDPVVRASMQTMDAFNQKNSQQDSRQGGHFTGGKSYHDRPRRGNQGDRPKSKAPIPDCTPWLLVKTKLGRRFVHNTETKQSLWKFPEHVMMAVIQMDKLEWEAKRKAESESTEKAMEDSAEKIAAGPSSAGPQTQPAPEPYDSDSYEEVEVTDDEENEESASKRARIDENTPPPAGPVEFDEDDIAYQLAQMEGDYGGGEDFEDEEGEGEGLPLTDADSIALFRSLLDDSGISPYAEFSKLVEDLTLVEDPRYVALPNTASRRDAFDAWSKDRIAELQALKKEEETKSSAAEKRKKDPKILYLRFLQRHASTKLYWPEFKRRYKREPEITARELQDKEREKLYRDFVAKLKLGESDRRKELVSVLKSAEKEISPGTTIADLPDSMVKDIRYYVLGEARRDELVTTWLETAGRK